MKRVFQDMKTGELIYFADDTSPEYRKFMEEKIKNSNRYLEWFTMQSR